MKIKFDETWGNIEPIVKEVLATASLDTRIIKPNFFNCQNLWADKINLVYDRFPNQTRKELSLKVKHFNGILKKCPWGIDGDYFDADFYPLNPLSFNLAHGTGPNKIIWGNFLGPIVNVHRLGVVGNPDPNFPTYLLDPRIYVPSNALLGGGGYLIKINSEKLSQFRNLFCDPEGIFNEKEFGSTFIIFGGIPVQAIETVCGTEYTH
jgi:hypothetical protein